VGTLAIGTSGAQNAGLLAARILACSDQDLRHRLQDYQRQRSEKVRQDSLPGIE